MGIISAIFGAITGLAGPIASAVMSTTVGKRLKADIKKMLDSNTELQIKLQNAYNNQNTKLLNSLAMTSPFGNAFAATEKAIKTAAAKYEDKQSKLTNEANKLQNLSNDVDNALMDPKYMGPAGIITAATSLHDINQKVSAARQAQEGGLQDGI